MSKTPEIAWRPNPGPPTEVLTRLEDEILMGGARGGSKTESGLAWMIEPEYIANERYQGLVIRRNSTDLSDWIGRARIMYRHVHAEIAGNPPIIKFPSGATIKTGHLKDENAYNKYLGHEYQKMLIEELTQIPTELLYLQLISACRSSIPGLRAQVFCTTNPGGDGHQWVKKRWIKVAYKRTFYDVHVVNGKKITRTRIFIPSRVWDTPQLYENDPGYIVFLNSLPAELRKAWRDGSWDVFAGQFFSEFSRNIHGVNAFEIPKDWIIFGALDYGEAVPTSFGLYAHDQEEDVIYRVAEYYSPGNGPDHIRKIGSLIKYCEWTNGRMPDAIYADPSMWGLRKDMATSRFPAQAFIEEGLPLIKGTNDRVPGWWECKRRLHYDVDSNGKMSTKPSFYYFIGQNANFEEYIPSIKHVENGNPEDAKKGGHDHVGDEFRYGMMGATEKEELGEDDDVGKLFEKERIYNMRSQQQSQPMSAIRVLEKVFMGR